MIDKQQKVDRRTQYTINIIKESFLKLIQKNSYFKLTVTKICQTAKISRSTFYLHFDTINDVLNSVLDDAIMTSVPSMDFDDNKLNSDDYFTENESLIPACQRVGSTDKYRKFDLSEYIIGRIMIHERPLAIPFIMKKTGLSTEDAETIFLFMLHGSFAINRANHFQKNPKWHHDVHMLNQFALNGYKALKSDSKE